MFNEVFDLVMKLEGGFVLHKNATEEAQTYAGIYRVAHPNWIGWTYLDEGETPPIGLVREVYIQEYWDKIKLEDSVIKGIIFEYGVNTGIDEAIKTAQRVLGLKEDGQIGPITQKAVQESSVGKFLAVYSIERTKRYSKLANKNPNKYGIYLRGWVNRVLESYEWFKNYNV